MSVSTVHLRGHAMAYSAEGGPDAPAVVLAHGILTDHRMWDEVAARLAPDFRVVRYDLRGHGASSASPAPYTLEELADDVVALLDALGLARVHFVGTSLGGMIGQQLGARHGDRLLSLTLANTGAQQAAPGAWDERIAVAREKGVEALAGGTLQRWFPEAFQRADPGTVCRMRSLLVGTSVEGFVGCAHAVRNLAQLDLLPRIAVPTLVVAGMQDESIPHAATAKLADLIPGAQLASLPTGHQAAVEQPQAFCDAWLAFLRQPPVIPRHPRGGGAPER